MSIKEQVDKLTLCIKDFAGYIDSLPQDLFLKKIDDWSPRDILAHLIGWNRYTIEGGQQIARGETPLYFIDPGDDFCKVNAVLVRKYHSTNKQELLSELEVSTHELKQFLLSLDPAEWESDYGVSYEGGHVTIKNTIDALIGDYVQHKEQIMRWVDVQIAKK